MKRRQGDLRTWAAGAASLHSQRQLNTTVDQFMQVFTEPALLCLKQLLLTPQSVQLSVTVHIRSLVVPAPDFQGCIVKA